MLRALAMRHIRTRHFASQLQLSPHISASISLHAGNRVLAFPAPNTPKERRMPQAIVPQEVHRQFTTLLRSDFLRHMSSNFLREIERHTKTTTLIERIATRSVIRHLAALSSSGVLKRDDKESAVSTLAERLRRQGQRTEEQWMPTRTVLLRRTLPPIQETQFIEAAPASFMPRPSTMNSPWSMPATQTGININQVTDEVVRKLDSRLIAARERFGKI